MTDSTFAGVGQVAGLEVWRIEKLQPVLQQNVGALALFHFNYLYSSL